MPKSKIYEHAKIGARLRKKFTDQVRRITWAYKLSPETMNLGATESVPEIEVFSIELKTDEISPDVIRFIDKAIPFPIIYEIVSSGRTKIMAAYKRPSGGDSGKWVTDIYFESDWTKEAKRTPLPVALDLGRLYEQMLAKLSPTSMREGESIRETAARIGEIRVLIREMDKIETKMRNEKQFNRKVELNAELRAFKSQLAALTRS